MLRDEKKGGFGFGVSSQWKKMTAMLRLFPRHKMSMCYASKDGNLTLVHEIEERSVTSIIVTEFDIAFLCGNEGLGLPYLKTAFGARPLINLGRELCMHEEHGST